MVMSLWIRWSTNIVSVILAPTPEPEQPSMCWLRVSQVKHIYDCSWAGSADPTASTSLLVQHPQAAQAGTDNIEPEPERYGENGWEVAFRGGGGREGRNEGSIGPGRGLDWQRPLGHILTPFLGQIALHVASQIHASLGSGKIYPLILRSPPATS